MVYAKGTLLSWGFCIPASELKPMLSTNKVVHAADTFCHRDCMCQVSNLQHINAIGLKLFSVLKTTIAAHHRVKLKFVGYILLHTTAPGCKGWRKE